MATMYSTIMDVTPEQAEEWLKSSPVNRKLKKDQLQKICNDIMNGRFQLSHQSIALDEDGRLIDGHHRLTAITRTGIPCKMYVTFNAPNSEIIDTIVPRSDMDALIMSRKIEKDSIAANAITYPLLIFIYSRNFSEFKARELSKGQKLELYNQLRHIIDPIIDLTRNRGHYGRFRRASVLYAMACALNAGVPLDVISDWYRIVITNDFYVEGDEEMTRVGRSVLAFNRHISDTPQERNMDDKMITVKKAMSSIDHYNNREPVQRLYGWPAYPDIVIESATQMEIKNDDQ